MNKYIFWFVCVLMIFVNNVSVGAEGTLKNPDEGAQKAEAHYQQKADATRNDAAKAYRLNQQKQELRELVQQHKQALQANASNTLASIITGQISTLPDDVTAIHEGDRATIVNLAESLYGESITQLKTPNALAAIEKLVQTSDIAMPPAKTGIKKIVHAIDTTIGITDEGKQIKKDKQEARDAMNAIKKIDLFQKKLDQEKIDTYTRMLNEITHSPYPTLKGKQVALEEISRLRQNFPNAWQNEELTAAVTRLERQVEREKAKAMSFVPNKESGGMDLPETTTVLGLPMKYNYLRQYALEQAKELDRYNSENAKTMTAEEIAQFTETVRNAVSLLLTREELQQVYNTVKTMSSALRQNENYAVDPNFIFSDLEALLKQTPREREQNVLKGAQKQEEKILKYVADFKKLAKPAILETVEPLLRTADPQHFATLIGNLTLVTQSPNADTDVLTDAWKMAITMKQSIENAKLGESTSAKTQQQRIAKLQEQINNLEPVLLAKLKKRYANELDQLKQDATVNSRGLDKLISDLLSANDFGVGPIIPKKYAEVFDTLMKKWEPQNYVSDFPEGHVHY